MATKAKSEHAPKSAPAPAVQAFPLADAFAKAVKLAEGGKHAEAVKALDALMVEAQAAGDWAVKRRAQVYRALAESKLHPPKVATPDTVTEIQASLNRRDTDGALKQLEKAIKAHPTHGTLHYLRAVAFAQMENAEGAAESLKKAVELEADLIFQWHMEPDFNSVRKSPLFAFTEGH
ncbi:TPR end-of-group domain-containing protein [Geothrix oryzisoli]|uniref:TPR end-of-group domain-containing protein n=1 Tax=Geothrix oryzisoli TaxID=2922721 RepID=UPI001FAB558F|nr:tetratricopeptide repeat protein [Geothrix oryzisoli]